MTSIILLNVRLWHGYAKLCKFSKASSEQTAAIILKYIDTDTHINQTHQTFRRSFLISSPTVNWAVSLDIR